MCSGAIIAASRGIIGGNIMVSGEDIEAFGGIPSEYVHVEKVSPYARLALWMMRGGWYAYH